MRGRAAVGRTLWQIRADHFVAVVAPESQKGSLQVLDIGSSFSLKYRITALRNISPNTVRKAW